MKEPGLPGTCWTGPCTCVWPARCISCGEVGPLQDKRLAMVVPSSTWYMSEEGEDARGARIDPWPGGVRAAWGRVEVHAEPGGAERRKFSVPGLTIECFHGERPLQMHPVYAFTSPFQQGATGASTSSIPRPDYYTSETSTQPTFATYSLSVSPASGIVLRMRPDTPRYTA